MVYIFETELPKEKSVLFALQKIYGIGYFSSKKICRNLGFLINMKIKNLNDLQLFKLVQNIENLKFIITNDLKKQILINNLKYVSIKSYRGLRKLQGLPIRGQRTHTNAKTARRVKRQSK